MTFISKDSPLAGAVFKAIHTGDVPQLKRLLEENPGLAMARIVGREDEGKCGDNRMSRTLLHVVTDWPGHFPNGAATVIALIEAGSEVNARFTGPHTETPLHWAASCDDIEVLNALLDAGADIEAAGAVIARGTPLDDAVAFGQWHAARRLVERGAKSRLWHAAALGLMDDLREYFSNHSRPPLMRSQMPSGMRVTAGRSKRLSIFWSWVLTLIGSDTMGLPLWILHVAVTLTIW